MPRPLRPIVTGKKSPIADEVGVVCLMDMGNTAALKKAMWEGG